MFGLAIPAWLSRYLPHALIVLAVLGGVWYIDHKGYQRAMADRDKADQKLLVAIHKDREAFETRAISRENSRAGETKGLLDQIVSQTTDRRTQIIKELTHEVRYTDPEQGIPDAVRQEINKAISSTACERTENGGITCAMRRIGSENEN